MKATHFALVAVVSLAPVPLPASAEPAPHAKAHEADRGCLGHSLELAGRKDSVEWTNAATGVSYRVTPTRNFQDGKEHCREFTTELSGGKGGKSDKLTGVACRGAKGEWLLKS